MSMRRPFPALLLATLALAALPAGARAATVSFNDDPFAGTTALTTPGRQIIGGERFIANFDLATDVLAFNPQVFGTADGFSLFNGVAAAIPPSGINFVVLQTFDGDGDPTNGVLLNAGLAANLVADAITQSGSGFFVYFNSGLDLPRLVFSTDLASADADLKVVARFTNLTGAAGRAALPGFSADNVGNVPEPASWAMMIAGFGLVGAVRRRQRLAMAAA